MPAPAEETALEPPPQEPPDVEEEEVPAAVTNPAAEIVTWLRGEFDGVHDRIQALSDRLAHQEAAVRAAAEARGEEIEVSLAELEGCAGRLRNEAAGLGELRASLADSMPQLAAEAVAPALAETAARAVAEVRGAVAELGAALAEALPPAVAQAVAVPSATGGAPPVEPETAGPGEATDLVTQLHEAQDEAAEWFTIVVDEAVRRAVERHLGPAARAQALTGAAPAAPPPVDPAAGSRPSPETADQPVGAAPVVAAPVAAEPPPGPSPAPAGTGQSTGNPSPGVGDGWAEAEPPPARASVPAEPGGHLGGGAAGMGAGPSGETPDRAAITAEGGSAGPEPVTPAGVETLVADLGLAPSPASAGQEPAFTPSPAANGTPPAGVRSESGVPPGEDGDDAPETDADRASAVACVLPGVAVGPTLALGVSNALRRARLRRRSRRPAGAPTAGLHRHDPFAGDLSLRLERFALARRNLAFGAEGAGAGPGGRPTTMVVAAELDEREVAVDLTEGPVALVGPGAADAGRALVTTFLVTHEPGSGRVVAVGDALPAGTAFPGLERLDDLGAALDGLEDELDRRQRVLAADGPGTPVPGPGPTGEGPAGAPSSPLLLLVTSAVPEDLSSRLADLLKRGTELGLTALAVGCAVEGAATVTLQPAAVTRSVSPEGRAHDLWGSRLFTLSSAATAELLEVLAASRTGGGGITGHVDDEPFTVLSPTAPPPIQVQLLGTYRLEVDGKEIKSGLRAKARELLAFYLLHTEGTTLDVATGALWPEADPGRGSEWFWTALGNLRTTLRRATGTKELMVVERDGDRYRIEPVFDVDLWRLQAALAPSAAADAGDPTWTAALQAAADLYGGELLADVDWAWVDIPREDLRRRVVDVLVALAAVRQRAGDVRGALDTLDRAVDVDPVAEQLYRRIMRLQANQSGPEEVASTFRRLLARLDEMDLEPTEESTRLAAELCGTG